MTIKHHRKKLILLDAHAIIHRAYHALPGFTSPSGEPAGALYGVVAMIIKIVNDLQPDYMVACFDLPQPTYRHEAYEEYKAGRKKAEEDLVTQIQRAPEFLEAFGIPQYACAGFEADDLLGTIIAETRSLKDLDIIIASGDMDTLQLVDKKRVRVYTLKKGINDTILYDEDAVVSRFGFSPQSIPDFKGLRGDPSDNIPGIKGIGEKTASTLIATFGSIEALYKKIKKDEDLLKELDMTPRVINLLKEGEDEAIFSKMLATIRTDAPITFTLPEKTWRAGIDYERVLDLCATFGFRSLVPRIKTTLAVSGEAEEDTGADEQISETALALWLLESDHTNPTREDILAYARTRGVSADLISARKVIFSDLSKTPMQKVFDEIEKPLHEVLVYMERIGIKLDISQLSTLSISFHKKIKELEDEIYAQVGTVFNINSPKQLGAVLFETLGIGSGVRGKKTTTGHRSTNESELRKLIDIHPVVRLVLQYRELQKLVGTYIDAFPKLVRDDGRIHSKFLQAGTTTGRLASRDPNMQNIPIRGEFGSAIRSAFVAEEGYTLVAFDYAQIELRIAAFLSGDNDLMEIFKKGEDIHTSVAAKVFRVSPREVTKDMRRHAKVINFGIMYGMGVNALRENLGADTTREDAQKFLNAYFASFPRLASYLEEVKKFAHEHGYTETAFGRRRYFPGIQSSIPYIRAQAERMAINAPIQGTEADLVRIAMVRVYEFLKEEQLLDDVRIILQIHDELIFEIKNKKVHEIIVRIKHILETVAPPEMTHNVPLEVGVKQGKDWGVIE